MLNIYTTKQHVGDDVNLMVIIWLNQAVTDRQTLIPSASVLSIKNIWENIDIPRLFTFTLEEHNL